MVGPKLPARAQAYPVVTPAQLANLVAAAAREIRIPEHLTIPDAKRVLRSILARMAPEVVLSNREYVAQRTPGDKYRGKLALVVYHPGETPATPGAYCAVEFAKSTVRKRSIYKLASVPKHLPICTMLICLDQPSNVDTLPPSLDKVIILRS